MSTQFRGFFTGGAERPRAHPGPSPCSSVVRPPYRPDCSPPSLQLRDLVLRIVRRSPRSLPLPFELHQPSFRDRPPAAYRIRTWVVVVSRQGWFQRCTCEGTSEVPTLLSNEPRTARSLPLIAGRLGRAARVTGSGLDVGAIRSSRSVRPDTPRCQFPLADAVTAVALPYPLPKGTPPTCSDPVPDPPEQSGEPGAVGSALAVLSFVASRES